MLLQVAALLSLAATATALDVQNLTSTGCVDASGFQSCQNDANDKIQKCFSAAAGSPEGQQGCACEDYILNYNCYATHCWNQVWGCEYQEYIAAYLLNCPVAKLPVPFFPAEKNAPGACSCNLGIIYNAITDSITQGATCMKNVNANGGNYLEVAACGCCEISGALSSIYETCPDTDPKLVGASYVSDIETQLDVPFSQCQPMTKINCASQFSFSLDGVSTYYPPSGLPASGTGTLSNLAGTVTAPPSGDVFSYTNGGDNVVYTITAASAHAAVTGSGAGGASAASTGSGSGSESGAAATQTGSSDDDSAGSQLGISAGMGIVMAFCAMFGIYAV